MRGAPHPSMTDTFTTMCTHHVQASAPFRGKKIFNFSDNACTGTGTVLLSFDWLASSYSAVNFKFWQQKKPYVRVQRVPPSFDWLAPAPFRGKRFSYGNLVTVHAETVTDDERVCL